MQDGFEIIEMPKEIRDKFPTLRNIKRICVTNANYLWGMGTIINGEKWEYISYIELRFLFRLRNYICKGVLEKYHKYLDNVYYWCANQNYFGGLLAKIHFGSDPVSDKIKWSYVNERWCFNNAVFVQYENEE